MSAINHKTRIRTSVLAACVLGIGSSIANSAPVLNVPSVTVK